MQFFIAAFYKFVSLPDYQVLRPTWLELCVQNDIKGTILLADEGMNGTIAGPRAGMDIVLATLRSDPRLADLEHKESFADEMPFGKMKVKLRNEIVTIGQDDVDPTENVGTYVEPTEWNNLIQDPDIILIDTRNEYEYEIGTFEGAQNPHTRTFRQFPDYVQNQLDPAQHKKVAMFCTGGIRCEKASSLMLDQGFEEVYHLKGGILKYLEEIPQEESTWHGECFVFDDRVTVNHDLQPGEYKDMCNVCKRPLTDEELLHPDYKEGVACEYCQKNE